MFLIFDVHDRIMLLFLVVVMFVYCPMVKSDGAAATKGDYEVINKNTKEPCIKVQGDFYLYLTYLTSDGEKDAIVHVPTSSTTDNTASSCDTFVPTEGSSVPAQLLRINLYHMEGWTLDLAFTKDNRFKTDSEKEFTLFQVNVTANFASDPVSFPNPKYPTQKYFLRIDPEELSDIAGSVYATVENSYYCPSEQKYVINDQEAYGPTAYIKFKLVTLQAYMTSSGFGPKETCPSDQRTTDLIPIIVGSSLAGLIIITLVVYLIYRTFLPDEIINLVNPESHYNIDNDSEKNQNGMYVPSE